MTTPADMGEIMQRCHAAALVVIAIAASPCEGQSNTLWLTAEPGTAYFIPQSSFASTLVADLPLSADSAAGLRAQIDMAIEHFDGNEDCSQRNVGGYPPEASNSVLDLTSQYSVVVAATVSAKEVGWAQDGGVSTLIQFSVDKILRNDSSREPRELSILVSGGVLDISGTVICNPGNDASSLDVGGRYLVMGEWSTRIGDLLEMAERLPLSGDVIVTSETPLLSVEESITVDQLSADLAAIGGSDQP